MEALYRDLTARPMRFLIRAEVARRMEDAIAGGLGGFRNQHELANAAFESYLLELMYPDDARVAVPRPPVLNGQGDLDDDADGLPVDGLQLESVTRGVAVEDSLSLVTDEPLLGLHNRDWPSLWALDTLAQQAAQGPVSLRRFLLDATSRAWRLADSIAAASPEASRGVTALLPTNRDKRQSAEGVFQTFAIASVAKRAQPSGRVRVSGPLPAWRAIGLLAGTDGDVEVGVTNVGWDLVDRMAGLTPWAPHPEDMTIGFFEHITNHSPGELWGFQRLLRSIRERPSRAELVAQFVQARNWKESVAASAAQGYLARGREWGLVETKIVDGTYRLTDLGRQFAEQL